MANYWISHGHKVSLLSFEDGSSQPYYELHQSVRVFYLGLNKYSRNFIASIRNNRNRLAVIRRAVVGLFPDVVISFIDTANVRTILALMGSRVPIIVSERVHPRFEQVGWLWSCLRRLSYPLADCLVVQTSQIASYCKGWARRVEIIANPVLPTPVCGGAPVLPRPCLLAVGRLYPQKGYDMLLRAFAHAAMSAPDWTLCIAGDGPLRADIARMAQELGLGDRVRLLGRVADVGGMLAQADAYVLSSRYEGFPNSLCEAMAAGLPCVSTDCQSGPADIVTHGVDGLLVANENPLALAGALVQLMGDTELRRRLGSAAQAVSARFSVERVMPLWERCIESCSPSKKRGLP